MTAQVHILGIRHHGPGSSRSLLEALNRLRPDVVLIEGPPEGESLLPLLADKEMKPPVAMLLYATESPEVATFYPFAVFSPEWQAIQYAARRSVPVKFIDLPIAVSFFETIEERKRLKDEAEKRTSDESLVAGDDPRSTQEESLRHDPLTWLAKAAGFDDGEGWWEHMVEHRQEVGEIFAAIRELMTSLRAEFPASEFPVDEMREALREAHMRHCIRTAEKEFKRIAVVCGAWHVPALEERTASKEDAGLLKTLSKTKVSATCIPWTHGRLSFQSGYRAGVTSPGWYHHLWTATDQPMTRWMTKVARLLRNEDLDASSAHIIEAVRLAEALASVRDRPFPTLAEVNDASLSVVCHGNPLPMSLIHRQLIVGDLLGAVPEKTPLAPLQQDLANLQRRLRLKTEATSRDLDLDLRNETDLCRSQLLHRLSLLGIPWGTCKDARRAKGTFHELWAVEWEPEFEVTLIERGAWGNTVESASNGYAQYLARQAKELAALTALLQRALLSDLSEAVASTIVRVRDEAALSNDVWQLTAALPPLAEVARYGDVRRTEAELVTPVVHGLTVRICVGLPLACASLNDEAAKSAYEQINAVHSAVAVLKIPELDEDWTNALHRLSIQDGLHGLIAGRSTRILLDGNKLARDEAASRLSLALSAVSDPAHSAAWLEGFLAGSGLLLVHDDSLLRIVDEWVAQLSADHFNQHVPILRRAFSSFHPPERRQIGERLLQGTSAGAVLASARDFDAERAERSLPLLAQLLGLKYEGRQS